ncbi:hypothetical protein J1605_021458 [Eschrichtius robustus]|uniref:Maspardin n=1 Tax=Eschrichtius robustus TaxID=9764 RepID=A0AB34HF86_ESCRO|nr:hypothetical protein J1605_021458 [Eschrichtius robustus]
MYIERRSLTLWSNPPRRHGDRRSHAAPPLPRGVAPPLRTRKREARASCANASGGGRAVAEARLAALPAPRRPALQRSPKVHSACGCGKRGPLFIAIIVDDDDSKIWSLYDAGPRNIRCPLIFLPPVSGTADVFFRQILALTGWGYRVIAVHLFGASLGGFLAQKFAEYTHKSPRVHSLILCNSFSDTSIFNQTWTANSFWLMPSFMLKKIVLGNFSSGPVDPMMADAIDFMVDRLESLGQSELASRLTLNCQNSYVEPHKIRDIPVTIMDVFDQSALSTEAKEEMYKLYPNARRAHLKTGGNFPYLCRSAEVNLYVQIHLLQFHGTKYAAIDPSMVSAEELEVQKGNLGISQEEQ